VDFTFTYISTPPMGRTACTEPQCLYKGALYLYLYICSPYGPYSLYRASVPVQGCTVPLPIPLLPVWAVQPVQSLSACTTVHCTFNFTSWITSPYCSILYIKLMHSHWLCNFIFYERINPKTDTALCYAINRVCRWIKLRLNLYRCAVLCVVYLSNTPTNAHI